MCMICTAIPATATAGIALNAKQKRAAREARENGNAVPKALPIVPLTVLAVGSLVAVSVATHTFLYK